MSARPTENIVGNNGRRAWRQKCNNSQAMRGMLEQPHVAEKRPARVKAVNDVKGIGGARFDREEFAKSVVVRSTHHKKGNTVVRDGKVFYLK